MSIEVFDVVELLALATVDIEAGHLDRALVKLKTANRLPDRNAEVDSQLARLYARLHLYDKALDHYRKFLDVHPESELEHFQYGMVHFDRGDYAGAARVWDGVLSRNPSYPPALFYRARACLYQERVEDARRDIDVLLKSTSTDNLYFNRGRELLEAIERRPRPGLEKRESIKGV